MHVLEIFVLKLNFCSLHRMNSEIFASLCPLKVDISLSIFNTAASFCLFDFIFI